MEPPIFVHTFFPAAAVLTVRKITVLEFLLFFNVLNPTQSPDASAPVPQPPDFVPAGQELRDPTLPYPVVPAAM
jgi:hypothetical protein